MKYSNLICNSGGASGRNFDFDCYMIAIKSIGLDSKKSGLCIS